MKALFTSSHHLPLFVLHTGACCSVAAQFPTGKRESSQKGLLRKRVCVEAKHSHSHKCLLCDIVVALLVLQVTLQLLVAWTTRCR